MKPLRFLVPLALTAAILSMLVGISTYLTAQAAPDASTTLVISQVYGGGGNSGAPYTNDFVVIYNLGMAPVSVSDKSIQYASATSTGLFSSNVTVLSGTIQANQYYLVKLAGGANGSPLPTADATGTTLMGATGGKVILVNSTTGLACNGGSTPCSPAQLALIIDLVGYGSANFYEGAGAAPALSNTTAAHRLANGCRDTDNNNLDFTASAPVPLNRSSPFGVCYADPSVTKSGPAQASPGNAIEYVLNVSNVGYAASDTILVTDILPADVSFITYTSSVPVTFLGSTPPEISWQLSSLAVNASTVITVQVSISPTMPDVITNTVQIATDSANNDLTSNDQDQFATAYSKPALVISKSGPSALIGGMDLVYTLNIQNSGNITATNVILTDTITGGATYITDSIGIPPTVAPGTLTWNLGNLQPGFSASYQITFTTDLTPTRDVLNTVVISTDSPAEVPTDNTDSVTTIVYELSTIAEARAGSVNQVFAITGKVTMPPGILQAPEWALQDGTGGIGVYYTPAPTLALGDSVVIVAPRTLFNGQEQMGTPLFFQNLGSGAPVAPKPYTTGSVAAGNSEGWLVQVEGIVSSLPSSCPGTSNYQFNVDDGSGPTVIYVDRDTHINVCSMGIVNGSSVRIIGFSTEYNGLMEIKPRYNSDVVFTQPQISKVAPVVVTPGQVFTYTLTATNKLGFDLNNVVISDTLPVNTQLADLLDGGVINSGVITWALPSLANNTSADVRFVVTATTNLITITNLDYAISAGNFITMTHGIPVYTFVTADGTLSIHHVQGAGQESLLNGRIVQGVKGIVTDLTNDGFFMQEPVADADTNTSEGIFVYTGAAPTVSKTDKVSIDGLVSELNGMTELKNVTITPIVGTETISPTLLTLPIAVGDSLEKLEGMWVTIPHTMTVSQNYFQGRYGQLTLSAGGRLFNPTNGNDLGDTFELDARRMLILDDGSNAENPNPIPYIGEDNTSRAGDTVSNLNGVLDQGIITSGGLVFYRLHPVATPVITRGNERTTAPAVVGGNVQIASFNVLNYFNGNGLGGGFPTSRGASTLLEFTRQRTKIITAMVAIDADIFGLMEIENDGSGNLSAINDLVSGLNALVTDPYTYTVEPAPGTDAIKVAMIYKPSVVTPVGPAQNFQITDHPTYVLLFDRPPLAQTFMLNENGEIFTVIVNHFKSKGSCPASGPDIDQGDGQGCWNAKRTAQAAGLLEVIEQIQTATGDEDVLVIGDLNSYGKEDPILAFLSGGLTNLSELYVPDETRYTYVFDGLAGQLDHALSSGELVEQATGVSIWHINADEPSVIDYNQEYKSQDLYTPTPYASSDHDPVLIGIDLQPTYYLYMPMMFTLPASSQTNIRGTPRLDKNGR